MAIEWEVEPMPNYPSAKRWRTYLSALLSCAFFGWACMAPPRSPLVFVVGYLWYGASVFWWIVCGPERMWTWRNVRTGEVFNLSTGQRPDGVS